MVLKCYPALFEPLNLKPGQATALKGLVLKEFFYGSTTNGLSLMDRKLDAAQRAKVIEELKTERDGYDTQIKQLLGAENYRVFQSYEKTVRALAGNVAMRSGPKQLRLRPLLEPPRTPRGKVEQDRKRKRNPRPAMRQVKGSLPVRAQKRGHRRQTGDDNNQPATENQPKGDVRHCVSHFGGLGERHSGKTERKQRRGCNMCHQHPMGHRRLSEKKDANPSRGQHKRAGRQCTEREFCDHPHDFLWSARTVTRPIARRK
jgi:hypothetical protein